MPTTLLCYSGGLDTSVILKWLIDNGHDVVCFLANVGQEEDFEAVRKKALDLGAKKMLVADCIKEIVKIAFLAIQCNASYDRYLLGTALARPVIAAAVVEAARAEGITSIAHGATAKGNDCIRFELAISALAPEMSIIAPWRLSEFCNHFQGRSDLLDYAQQKSIPVTSTTAKPWSMDDNLLHCSYEAGKLERVAEEAPTDLWTRTVDPEDAPNTPEIVEIEFKAGIPIRVTAGSTTSTDPIELFKLLNDLGRKHGVGRIDIVENRFIGIKSRGCYDSPAMTILRTAHMDLEGLTLDGEVTHLRNAFVSAMFGKLVYDAKYFSPECDFVINSLVYSQGVVNGWVKVKLYKGFALAISRDSPNNSLYSETISSMDTLEGFDPTNTTGFINTNAIRLKNYQRYKQGLEDAHKK